MQKMDSLNFAFGRPQLSATLKQEFTDFKVDEELGFELDGEGEHLWIQVQKTDLSTTDVAKRLATECQLRLNSVGYSGMKDRRGECTQWFSAPLESAEESMLAKMEDSNLKILNTCRNRRKLKIGSHKLNHFRIRLRDCVGSRQDFNSRLEAIKANGVPNYFGSQRFGRNMSNIVQVETLMRGVLAESSSDSRPHDQAGRVKRGILLSAARAYVFNQYLSQRVGDKSWCRYLDGDVLNLDGTSRFFVLANGDSWDEALQRRLETFDIHLTGPLPGKKDSADRYGSTGISADMEEVVLKEYDLLVSGLAKFKVVASRRSMRFVPADLTWGWLDSEVADLNIQFTLPKGAYATSLLRELCVTD